MLGNSSSPALKLKAMETFGMAMFLVEACQKYRDRLGPDAARIVESGRLLVEFRNCVRRLPPNVGHDGVQLMLDCWKRFMK
eukprot:12913466-Alexandrium_andersonii.AAC.1